MALSTFVTGKLTMAYGRLGNYAGISLRVWPLSIGPQLRVNRLTLIAELGIGYYFESTYITRGIFTAGLRFYK